MANESLQWSSSGHEVSEKGADWYWILWIIAASLAISCIFFFDFLTALLVIIAAATITLLAKTEVTLEDYKIDAKGITVDDRMYPYDHVKGFDIIEREDMNTLLIVHTGTVLNPYLFIHLTPEVSVEQLRKFLGGTLTELNQGIPLSHLIVERLGL